LKDTGFVEGENVAIEYRWADNQIDRLPALATELVQRRVAVIPTGGPPAAFAAKAATSDCWGTKAWSYSAVMGRRSFSS
jgi:putative ABC transport system substrate-binding protein